MELPFAEAWKIKMVEPIRKSTRQEREQWLKEAHYNVFQLKSEQVYIDLITDSGTGAMSDRQWAGMMLGDESYAGATSFFRLKEVITRLTGFEYIIPPTRDALPKTCSSPTWCTRRHCAGKLPFRHHQRTYRGTPGTGSGLHHRRSQTDTTGNPLQRQCRPPKTGKSIAGT